MGYHKADLPRVRLGRRARATLITAGLSAVAVVLMAGLAISPIAISLVSRYTKSTDWSRLSAIGQTYGAASTILAAVAIGGVAISLLLQVRQLKIGQIQAMRNMQLELMRLLLSDPALEAASPSAPHLSTEQWRKDIFTNLMFKYLEMGYVTNYVSEQSLRRHIEDHFKLDGARSFWPRVRPLYELDAKDRARRRFLAIVEDQFRRALDQQATTTGGLVGSPHKHDSRPSAKTGGPRRTVVGLTIGVAAGTMIIRRGIATRRRRELRKSHRKI